MTLRQSFPTDSTAGQSVTDTRLTNAALVARDAAGMPRPGVIFDSPARIVSPTSSMAYLVRDLRAVTMRTPGGVEFLANDGAVTIPTTPAPASNARIDIIYMRARFIANADGSSLPEFGVRQSAPAVNPVDPALPVGALPLARFVIPAIATSTQASGVVGVDIAPFTCAAGGTLTVRTPAELENWKPADGAKAYSLSDTSEYVRTSGRWSVGGAKSFAASNQSAPLGAGVTISLAAPAFGDAAMHSAANPTRLVAARTGPHVVTITAATSNTNGGIATKLRVNGVDAPGGEIGTASPIPGWGPSVTGTTVLFLSAGDYVEGVVTSTVNTALIAARTSLSISAV